MLLEEDAHAVAESLFRSVREAILRTIATSKLIPIACSISPHPDRLAAVTALEGRKLSDRDLSSLSKRVLECVRGTALLKGNDTQAVNGALRRLCRLLDTKHLRIISPLLLNDTRAGRRRAVVAALHRAQAPKESLPGILRLYATSNNVLYLSLLARSPETASVAAERLDQLNEPPSYWVMRAIASQLIAGTPISSVAREHVEEYVQAIGWLASKGHRRSITIKHLKLMDRLVNSHTRDLDLLYSAIWTCGHLRDAKRLCHLEQRIRIRLEGIKAR